MLRNKMLMAVAFTVFAAYLGSNMVLPVRVLYAQAHGASLAIIGAMATAFLVSNFIFQYPMGWIADRWGRKRIMIAGLIAQMAVTLGYLFVSDPVLFVALRFVEGVASATMLPPARALIADIIVPEQRGEAYGVFSAFFNASLLLGPGIGSGLAIFSYESVFIGAIAVRLVALVIVLVLIPESAPRRLAEGTRPQPVSQRQLLTLPLLGSYILVFGDYLYIGFDMTLFPLWMHDHLGASVAVIGLAYIAWAIPNTILSPVGGRIADRMRRSGLILVFGAAQVPLYIAYGLMNVAWPIVALWIVHGAIYAMMQPAVDTHLAAASLKEARGRVQGFYSSIGLAGAFAGATGFSVLYDIDYHLPLFALGVAFGVCVLIGGLLVRYSEAHGLVAGPRASVEHVQEVA